MVCFEDRLATEWYRIYQAMETIVDGQIGKELLIRAVFKAITMANDNKRKQRNQPMRARSKYT